MSWILGNDNTSFLTDLQSLFHNATTGELTPEQKQEIATNTTKQYIPCRDNPTSDICKNLFQQISTDVNIVAPSTNCKIRLSDSFCFESWNTVIFTVVAAIAGLYLLQIVIASYPAYLSSKGR